MSYQVIARKWRPQTFEEVTGQEAITRTLRNAVEHERLHHAYLFSGARGVGKTTTARLLAKALNCHKTPKPNPTPCSPSDPTACASCREISESRSIDVFEFDAASHTGVDDIREIILESINIAPARDRYKVFIIDEVHMLSNSSFNALLKTLEEPPPNVVFIMATTELHKVPDTILSRTQEFEFRTIAAAKIFARLRLIADAEKVNISDDALREIARAGEGSMRDAQSAFDQVISFSGEKIAAEDVAVALGIAGSELLVKTVEAIGTHDAKAALSVVEDLIGRGHDLRNFCRDLLALLRDMLVAKVAGESETLFDSSVMSRDELTKLSADFSESDLIRFFNSLSETETKLKDASAPRYVLEIGLVKLMEMRRVTALEKILERLADLENSSAQENISTGKKSEAAPPTVSAGVKTTFAPPEKKTSIIDFPPAEVPFPVSASTVSIAAAPARAIAEDAPEPPFIFAPDDLPVRLPAISAEELEHFDDNKLDAAFEERLERAGDKLLPILNASAIAAAILGNVSTSDSPMLRSGETALAISAKPIDIPETREQEEISQEMPVLPENPTEEDLWRYAENHPHVRKALKIFRGKIVSVWRDEERYNRQFKRPFR